jgi:hypothetical protein
MITKLIKCRYHAASFPLFFDKFSQVENLQVRVTELQEELKGRNHLENIAVNGKIILKWVLGNKIFKYKHHVLFLTSV